jgi:molybdopterin/thiamine biosynthesis adenylyltransferase
MSELKTPPESPPELDFTRQFEIFDAAKHRDTRVDIIGLGATGSHIAYQLAKVGMANLHAWDFDTIEPHNIPNQNFFLEHIGQTKTAATAEMIERATGVKVTCHEKRLEKENNLGPIVFLLVDSMDERKKVFDSSIRRKLKVKLVIETRMGAELGRIYTFDPSMPSHLRHWENTLCSDAEAEVSACGFVPSIIVTASMIANIAVWQMIYWLNKKEVDNEVIVCTSPWNIITNRFSA